MASSATNLRGSAMPAHEIVSHSRVICPELPEGELGMEGSAISRSFGVPVCSLCGEEI